MAELTINWETLSSIPQPEKQETAVITSETGTEPEAPAADAAVAPAKFMADKPYFIYVSDPSGAASGFDAIEQPCPALGN